LSFTRNKTKNSTRSNLKRIIVPLTEFSKQIIQTYGNRDTSPDNYVFPIFNHSMDEHEKLSANQAFTRFINQHIKKLAKLAGISEEISTYWARHCFASIAVQNGASLEFVQDSLGHTSIKTTMDYWSGFEDEAKKQIAEKLLNF
jgi:integrase/recombinase XerD